MAYPSFDSPPAGRPIAAGCPAVRRACLPAVAVAAALAGACASTGARPQPFPEPGRAPQPPAISRPLPVPAGVVDGYAIATAALALQGVPYRSGGADPSGFDCSGLVQFVLGEYGIRWPRVVHDQFAAGREVSAGDIEPGDLVFFATESREVSHVGIAIGGDRFVHAPNARGVVRVESLGSEYWSRHFAGARRVAGGGS